MKITPLDIQKKQFPIRLRGIDKDDVYSFLELVREEMEELSREHALLKEEDSKKDKEFKNYREELVKLSRENTQLIEDNLKMDNEIKDYKKLESVLTNMFIGTQQMLEEYKNKSQKEIDIIKENAELQAGMITEDAQKKAIKIHEDIEDLKKVKIHFKDELKKLIDSHMKMFEVCDDMEQPANFKSGNNGDKEKIILLPA